MFHTSSRTSRALFLLALLLTTLAAGTPAFAAAPEEADPDPEVTPPAAAPPVPVLGASAAPAPQHRNLGWVLAALLDILRLRLGLPG